MRRVIMLIAVGMVMMSSGAFAATGTGTLNRVSAWQQSGSNFIVTATAASNSMFTAWQGDTNGCTIAGTNITITANQARQITALFSIKTYLFNVASAWGTATPLPGSYTNEYGTLINASVTSPVNVGLTTQYVATGWVGTGGLTNGLGTSAAFTIVTNSSITWQWRTNYYLTTATTGSGSVNVVSAWYTNNASVVVTATASNGWSLTGWSGDTNGCTIAGNQITAPMVQARALTANFGIILKTLQVNSAYGITVPAVGTSTNNWGTIVTCSVTNSPVTMGTTQYVCAGWVMTGNTPLSGSGTNFTMTVTNNAVLTWQWKTNYWIDFSVIGN